MRLAHTNRIYSMDQMITVLSLLCHFLQGKTCRALGRRHAGWISMGLLNLELDYCIVCNFLLWFK